MQFKVFDLGLIDFNAALLRQKELFSDVKTGALESALIICRHYPVITLGRLADKKNILFSPPELKKQAVEVCGIERGGDVTYHGPGQIIAYPVFNLSFLKKDIHFFLRQLESVVIDFLSDFGVKGLRKDGLTGVWVGSQKISSIGIAIKNWITFHGVSINLKKDDLPNFQLIRPCGMDIEMVSLESLLERKIEIDEVTPRLIGKFRDTFLYH